MHDLPIMEFANSQALRDWLEAQPASSPGIWLRIYKKHTGIPSVTFLEVLDEGLCFGWSESTRRAYDAVSYLQRFTPRKTSGTQSKRNRERAQLLIQQGRMTAAGLHILEEQ